MPYLLDAFSANMLSLPAAVTFHEIPEEEAATLWATEGMISAVGHADTAALFSSVLGFHVPCLRSTVSLSSGDWAIIGQYSGPRLPEGASINWIMVKAF